MKSNWSKYDTNLLIEMLQKDTNPIRLCDLICELTRRGVHSSRVKNILVELSNSTDKFWNTFTVSDFAIAGLDLMGWKKYDGKREEINKLISSKLIFD